MNKNGGKHNLSLSQIESPLVPGTFGALIGFEMVKRKPGKCICTLEIRDELLNPYGAVHGGVTFSIADSIMGLALYDTLEIDEECATNELKINYVRFARSGNLTCTATLIEKKNDMGFVNGEVKNNGKLIAHITGTFHILQNRKNKRRKKANTNHGS